MEIIYVLIFLIMIVLIAIAALFIKICELFEWSEQIDKKTKYLAEDVQRLDMKILDLQFSQIKVNKWIVISEFKHPKLVCKKLKECKTYAECLDYVKDNYTIITNNSKKGDLYYINPYEFKNWRTGSTIRIIYID